MAHTVQAKKRIRQLKKHAETNRMRMSRIRTFLRNVEQAIESGDKPAAQDALKAFQPEITDASLQSAGNRETNVSEMPATSRGRVCG